MGSERDGTAGRQCKGLKSTSKMEIDGSSKWTCPTIMFPCFYNKAVLLAARLFNNFSMTVNANI